MEQKELGDRYSDLRMDRGLTQRELAAQIDINNKTISFYENGSRAMTLKDIVKYANFFGVSADYLLGLTDAPAKKPAAVDELKLSNQSIQAIKEITCNKNKHNLAVTLQVLLENPKFFAFLDLLTDSVLKGTKAISPPEKGCAVPMLIESGEPGYSLIHDSMLKEYFLQLAMDTLRNMLDDVTVEVEENGQHS